MRYFALSLLLLSACSTPMRAPSSKELPWGLRSDAFPEPNAIIRWADPRYEETKAPRLDDLEHAEIPASCADKKLYPTHPQQFSKIYHVFRMGIYDGSKVPAESEVCIVATNGSRKLCSLPDTFEYAVISDIYRDGCGGLYRGVWQVGFLKRNDNMGQLFAKGRTVYPKEGSAFSGDMEEGQTYPLQRSEFLFLTSPFAGDKETAEKLAKDSSGTHSYDPATHLFQKKRKLSRANHLRAMPLAQGN